MKVYTVLIKHDDWETSKEYFSSFFDLKKAKEYIELNFDLSYHTKIDYVIKGQEDFYSSNPHEIAYSKSSYKLKSEYYINRDLYNYNYSYRIHIFCEDVNE